MGTALLLKYRRMIEDRLLYCKVNIDLEISVTWEIAEMHQNDKRRLSANARIGISDHVTLESSPWCKGQLAQGKLNDIPLVRTRDMRVPSCVEVSGFRDPVVALNAGQRASQKGTVATSHILKNCLQTIPSHDTVIVAEMWPRQTGEWAHGVFKLQLEKCDRQQLHGSIGGLPRLQP